MKSSINHASLGFSLVNLKTRKAIFLDEMDRVVPWARLVDLIARHYPDGRMSVITLFDGLLVTLTDG